MMESNEADNDQRVDDDSVFISFENVDEVIGLQNIRETTRNVVVVEANSRQSASSHCPEEQFEVHSDSFLMDSDNEKDEQSSHHFKHENDGAEDHQNEIDNDDSFQKIPFCKSDRRSSIRYMEEASIETELLRHENNGSLGKTNINDNQFETAHRSDHTVNSRQKLSATTTHCTGSSIHQNNTNSTTFTKIGPAGPLGRRRSSRAETEVVYDFLNSDTTTSSESWCAPTLTAIPAGAAALVHRESSLEENSYRDLFQSMGTTDPITSFQKSSPANVDYEQIQPVAGTDTETSPVSICQQRAASKRDTPRPSPFRQLETPTAFQVLQSNGILPPDLYFNGTTVPQDCSANVEDNDATALYHLLDGFCVPNVSRTSCTLALQLAQQHDYTIQIPLPDQPMISMERSNSRIVTLLQERRLSSKQLPLLLQLPTYFGQALLRILIRVLSQETDAEYNQECFFTMPWRNMRTESDVDLTKDSTPDIDHATQRPHLQYSVARFQCTWMATIATSITTATASAIQHNSSDTKMYTSTSSCQSINNDSRLAVQSVLSLWERVVSLEPLDNPHRVLIAPLARFLGLLATAGLTPRILRRMLSVAQSSQIPPLARLSMVRALKTAAAGASRSSLLPKLAPRQFFSFGGSTTGLQRTISGLATWPFRNDFGFAVWFRVERVEATSEPPILLSARTEDGGGVEISIVPIEKVASVQGSCDSRTEACTIAVSIFDSCRPKDSPPEHSLIVRGGCVLLPRVWYHLAMRHTRSRLKGVFSLSTRQQVSVMLDGKNMIAESLPFPKMSDSDFADDNSLMSSLRRSSGHSSLSITLKFGESFEGQTGTIHIFNDNVSDASFRALYEATGQMQRRSYSMSDTWDARRCDMVRKSRILDAKFASDDSDDIILSQRRRSNKKKFAEKISSVLDLMEGEDQEESDLPVDLQKAAFGSKIFITWDPRRTSGFLAFELHVGAHVNLDRVFSWRISGAQDVISSIGGVQSLIPLFRSFVNGEIERNLSLNDCSKMDAIFTALPDFFALVRAFLQDHNCNIREMLRCGGIDVIEQLLYNCKKCAAGKESYDSMFGLLSSFKCLATLLFKSLLELRQSCSQNIGLETKIYSRIIFNIPLWIGGFAQIPGASFQTVLLPVLSHLTKQNPEKVRDCVGVLDFVNCLKEYMLSKPSIENVPNRFCNEEDNSMVSPYALSYIERRHIKNILLGMIFDIIGSGTSPNDFAPFINLLTYTLDEDNLSIPTGSDTESISVIEERRTFTLSCCTAFLLLLQVRPVIPGLYESFAHSCGGVQGAASWILSTMVNSYNDSIRSVGVRCVAAFLDVASRGADAPLSLGSLAQPAESDHRNRTAGTDVSSTVRRASHRFTRLAQGLASMGPRAIVLAPSRLTARVVFKLLWHFLKSHRSRLGELTHVALLSWITDDGLPDSSSLASLEYLKAHMMHDFCKQRSVHYFNLGWIEAALDSSQNFIGKSLRNPLAIGTVLRLLRFLESDHKDRWLSAFLALTKSNRKCVSTLASLSEWQTSLFPLISETLELVSSHPGDQVDKEYISDKEYPTSLETLHKRLDLCLHLYSSLLGHLLRSGGDRSLEAVEKVVALQRVFVNGQHVLLLILGSLCGNVFEDGTLLEVMSLSAQDWKEVNIEEGSLLLRQSARLTTDAILSNGTKGLDLTTAVRSWRSLRHLTEVIVAIVTRSGFGIVDLFDYVNHKASSIDMVSGGLHGIRLPESYYQGTTSVEYVSYLRACVQPEGDRDRGMDRRLCARLAAQVLALLDAFIFPQSLDASIPVVQLDGFALVRFSEARLGSSQGPLISSAIRLSCLLMTLLEPCSVIFLQCASRLRCLLCWALELIRESSTVEGNKSAFHRDGIAHIDRLVLAVVLHCHRALGRCAALLSEIETASYERYFESREIQKKHCRRLFRVALELRDVVSTAYRGRNDLLRSTLSMEAHDAIRSSLEGAFTYGKMASKECVVRDFLKGTWVAGFQDTITRQDLAVPEQVSMDYIPLSSDEEANPGFAAIDKLAKESDIIVSDFEKAIDSCFEEYLEAQRGWAETDAVRDLEYDGDTTTKKLLEKYKGGVNEATKLFQLRRTGAESRWRTIQKSISEPWKNEIHWKLARYADPLGRRTLLVQNKEFNDHHEASYDLIMGKEREKEEVERLKRLRQKQELTEVMRRNAAAFVGSDSHDEMDGRDDDSSALFASDGESSTDAESSTDVESNDGSYQDIPRDLREDEQDEGWDKIDDEEIQDVDAHGESDNWAKLFVWSEDECIVARFEPVMIVSLQTVVEGKILLTNHSLYFHQVGNEINGITKEPIDEAGSDMRDKRWRLNRLTEIHGRRFILRQQALELFFSDSHELLLNFPGGIKERDRFYAKMRNSCKVPMLWSAKSLSPRVIFRRSKLSELWKKRKMSNFEYLMSLNRMAGRSFNDLTQYPVFPWVLADYASESLDLTDTRVYRDLSKPIGALNPDRLARLIERYNELESFGFTEAEKFLYGSHYSSPGIVLHYLIRQEPFTSMAIDLQSGRFDCPDRLFFDVAESWNSCLTSTSDMKELIPEFFSLPEMFLNTNKFPLGRTQSGRLVDDVGLPPWAKGSAFEFVRMHRMALESDYVSQNLHHWIDLVFGYKQRGPESKASHNIFHHLSYEGSVDLDKITDEVDRNAAESHIQNFGQTPSQLLSEDPHPSRYASDECWRPLIHSTTVAEKLRCHAPSKQFANRRSEHAKGPVLQLHVLSESLVVVYADMSVGTYRWFPNAKVNRLRMDKLRPLVRRKLSTSRIAMKRGSAIPQEQMEQSILSIGNWSIGITLGGLVKDELRRNAVLSSGRLISASEMSLATAESSALIISCGYWDETLKAHSVDTARVLASETGGHHGAIRCMALGQDGALMVTGGQDATTRVWVVDHPDMSAALLDTYVQTALGHGNDGDQLLKCCHVLFGHDSPVCSVVLDPSIDAVVSGSTSGLLCVHTLRQGDFIRSFRPPSLPSGESAGAVAKLAMGTEGTLVVHMGDQGLHTFTVNAVHLCTVDVGESLNDMKICSNDELLVTGGDRCQLLFRRVTDLQVCSMMDLSRHGPIRCIAFTPSDLNPIQQYLFIGSDDGMITIVDEDPHSTQSDNRTMTF